MNHILLLLVPDKKTTLIAVALSVVAFLLGLVNMTERDFSGALFYLHLSIGIMAGLFVLKFFSMRATYHVAEHAQTQLHHKIRKMKDAPRPKDLSEAEIHAQEKSEMAELADNLKKALANIALDSPVRPKYEATLELLERMNRKNG
jgi:hypothetical protein